MCIYYFDAVALLTKCLSLDIVLDPSAADFPPTGWGLQSQANSNHSPEEKQNQTYIFDERLDCQAQAPQQLVTNT